MCWHVLQYDQKNIRRRVYDALNVLMAMNIISKEKKEIRWIGLPTNSAQECQNLEVTVLDFVSLAGCQSFMDACITAREGETIGENRTQNAAVK